MAYLNWTDQLVEDLITIGEFISKNSLKFSVIQVKRLRERAKILKVQPLLGRVVPEKNDDLHDPLTRKHVTQMERGFYYQR